MCIRVGKSNLIYRHRFPNQSHKSVDPPDPPDRQSRTLEATGGWIPRVETDAPQGRADIRGRLSMPLLTLMQPAPRFDASAIARAAGRRDVGTQATRC